MAASRDWIDRARGQLEAQPVVSRVLPETIFLRAVDRNWRVHYGVDCGRRRWLAGDDALRLPVPHHHPGKARALLRAWLAACGREYLVPWLRQCAQKAGIDYRKTQVRGQKTRWGSCSARGTISLNYCLLFLDRELVEYLLFHELCHRVHFNHSARYWKLVGRLVPEYRQLDRRLGEAWREVPGWALP